MCVMHRKLSQNWLKYRKQPFYWTIEMDLFRSIRRQKKEHFIDIMGVQLIECEE